MVYNKKTITDKEEINITAGSKLNIYLNTYIVIFLNFVMISIKYKIIELN